jgi:membrane protein implicated in regulation of membrane protease activity
MGRISGRLIITVASTLFEEVAIAAIWLWILPGFGVRLPVWGLALVLAAWTASAVFFYRVGSRALKRKPVPGLGSPVGSRGKVVRALAPEGLIKVAGELWGARSQAGDIGIGEEVTVIGRDGLKLTVIKVPGGQIQDV